jgi:hypothetical protein
VDYITDTAAFEFATGQGYENIEQLAEAVLSDSVSPAICMNEGCEYTCEMEPDQDAGFCEECRTNSMPRGTYSRRSHLTNTASRKIFAGSLF